MRLLITGGAGCLGSNLVDRYLPDGHEILVIDNFATGKKGNVPPVAGLTVVEGSIAEPELVDRVFDDFQPTHVIHSAASYQDPGDWRGDVATNVQGTIQVAEAATRHRVKRLVHFQTALCYGQPDSVPVPVTHPLRPFTSYGISKVAGESYLAMTEVPTVSLRLGTVVGPRLAIGPLPTFYKRLKEGKSCYCSDVARDFMDMTDFLSLMDRVLAEDAPTGAFNVSTGEGHTIKEVFDIVANYLDVAMAHEVPIYPPGADDVSTMILDPTQTEKAFNWQAEIGFQETIRRMLAWYDVYGVTDVFSHLNDPCVGS